MRAILSDIHANYPALEAVLDHAGSLGVTQFLCLGDVIGYNGQPEECVQRLSQMGIPNILGNHDSYVTTGQNCDRSKVVAGIIDKHRLELSAASVNWLKMSADFVAEEDTLFLHGGPNDHVDEYLYEVGEDIFPADTRRLFAGHTHVQVRHVFGGKTFVNPGSVGQPRDGDPRAAYAVLDGEDVQFKRVPYDIDQTVNAMKSKGYEEFMWRGLYSGTQINGKVSEITRRG